MDLSIKIYENFCNHFSLNTFRSIVKNFYFAYFLPIILKMAFESNFKSRQNVKDSQLSKLEQRFRFIILLELRIAWEKLCFQSENTESKIFGEK